MCHFCIDPVYRGPHTSGNGGYVAGMFAKHLSGDSEVMLLQPPPLETDLQIRQHDGQALLLNQDEEVAKAKAIEFPDFVLPEAPTLVEAESAVEHSPSKWVSQQIDCFVCSNKRQPGEGLRIFAGPVGRDRMVAAPWEPYDALGDSDGNIKTEFVWAALDCPGAFAAYAYEEAPFLLLGKQAAHIEASLSVKERFIATGWHVRREGRKHFTNTAIFSVDGQCLARATQVWIEVKRS